MIQYTEKQYIIIYWHINIYIYHSLKVTVRMPPQIPNISPPQLDCGTPTAKIHSVRMPHHPLFKFFLFSDNPLHKSLTQNAYRVWISSLLISLFFLEKGRKGKRIRSDKRKGQSMFPASHKHVAIVRKNNKYIMPTDITHELDVLEDTN